jgi:hypothetical protein
MPIYKTNPTNNFSMVPNEFWAIPMPYRAKEVCGYLLGKPQDWNPNPHEIAATLNHSLHIIKKSLQWLVEAGYATYERLKSGHTIWNIYSHSQNKDDAAATPAFKPQFVKPHLAFCIHNKTEKNTNTKKQQPEQAVRETKKDVVVFCDNVKNESLSAIEIASSFTQEVEVEGVENHRIEKMQIPIVEAGHKAQELAIASVVLEDLVFHEQAADLKKPLLGILKQVDKDLIAQKPHIKQDLLNELSINISRGSIRSSVPGFLRSLVIAANSGTFSASKSPEIRVKQKEVWERQGFVSQKAYDEAMYAKQMASYAVSAQLPPPVSNSPRSRRISVNF